MSEYDNNYEDATVESVETDNDNTEYEEQTVYQAYEPEGNGKAFAIVSLVCGIASVILCWCYYLVFILAIMQHLFHQH